MPLWRDPLEELVDQLERSVLAKPTEPASYGPLPPLEDFQLAIHAILSGSPEDVARADQDPRIQAVWAYYERLRTTLLGPT